MNAIVQLVNNIVIAKCFHLNLLLSFNFRYRVQIVHVAFKQVYQLYVSVVTQALELAVVTVGLSLLNREGDGFGFRFVYLYLFPFINDESTK